MIFKYMGLYSPSKMRIAAIKNNSSAEVKGHFSDVIWFQGCHRRCSYCFNPLFQSLNRGMNMTLTEILERLSEMSDVVVFTGGEPLIQQVDEITYLVKKIHKLKKKVILETSVLWDLCYHIFDKIYYSIRDSPQTFIPIVNKQPNTEIVVVAGYPEFNIKTFEQIVSLSKKDIWIKYYNGFPNITEEMLNILNKYNKPIKVLDKLIL